MIDNTLRYYGLIMEKNNMDEYPIYKLPVGYEFILNPENIENEWCRIQYASHLVSSMDEAHNIFQKEFKPHAELLGTFCIFVRNQKGELVATASLWPGNLFGFIRQRVHWISVVPFAQGLGIGKALLTRLLYLSKKYYGGEWIYLTTQSWNYNAVAVYYKFGFKPYCGEQPVNWYSYDFVESNRLGWELADNCIQGYLQEKPEILLIGDTTIGLKGVNDHRIARWLKKNFTVLKKAENISVHLHIHESPAFALKWENEELNVFLTEQNIEDEQLLSNVIWYCYMVYRSSKGVIFIPLLFGRQEQEEGHNWVLSIFRKGKYKSDRIEDEFQNLRYFWEIYDQNEKLFFRNLEVGFSYNLAAIQWLVQAEYIQKVDKVSFQAGVYRMMSFGAIILKGCYPILSGGKVIGYMPVSPFEKSYERQKEFVEKLIRQIPFREVIGL